MRLQRADRRYFVYALVDPRTREPRYVGITMDLHRRKREHIAQGRLECDRRCFPNAALMKWLADLYQARLEPEVRVLQEDTYDVIRVAGREWIKRFRDLGVPLLNGHTYLAYPKPI